MNIKSNYGFYYYHKKTLFVILHIFALILFISGVSLLYCNDNFGKGLSWMNSESYEDSPAFMAQFNNDISTMFDYIDYKNIFETNGVFDPNRQMFSIDVSPGKDVIYTINDVIKYAKSNGYSLDNDYSIIKKPDTEYSSKDNTVSSSDSYLVNWRIYKKESNLSEPGDAYMTLDDLTEESLECIGKYHSAYERLTVNPTNFLYTIIYPSSTYTNDKNLTTKSAKTFGRYAICNYDKLIIENNLPNTPSSLAYLAQSHDYSDDGAYTVIVATNTAYPVSDAYTIGQRNYVNQRNLYFYGLVLAGFGLILMFISAVFLVLFSGKTINKAIDATIIPMDNISIESNIILCAITAIFSLYLGEKIGNRILHLTIPLKYWVFSENMLSYFLIYICIFITFFVAVRQFKAGILWKQSSIRKIKNGFFKNMSLISFKSRISLEFFSLLLFNIIMCSIITFLWIEESTLTLRFIIIAFIIVLVIVDLLYYKKQFSYSTESDKLAEAIKTIASGDTTFQLNLSEFSCKEYEIAFSLNNIGRGLDFALNEQVKSERLKANLITNVSHDIKTPLTSIINYVDLIKREHPSDPKIIEYLNILDQKSQHLKNLTEDLVEASKASSGNMSLDMSDINFVELVQQTNGEFEEKYASRQLTIISNIPNEAIIIRADGRHLWRVLENVYDNAYKYAAHGSRVYTDITTEDSKVLFVIKNISENPLNISPSELTERFVRGDVSRSTEGSGLGLSIAQSLTQLQNADFKIQIDGDYFKVLIRFDIVS